MRRLTIKRRKEDEGEFNSPSHELLVTGPWERARSNFALNQWNHIPDTDYVPESLVCLQVKHYTPSNHVVNRNTQKSQLHIMALTEKISETEGSVTDYVKSQSKERRQYPASCGWPL